MPKYSKPRAPKRGRPRSKSMSDLPKHVYLRGDRFIFLLNKKKVYRVLGRKGLITDMELRERARAAMLETCAEIPAEVVRVVSVKDLAARYLASPKFAKISLGMQATMKSLIPRMLLEPFPPWRNLGDAPIRTVRLPHITRYLEEHSKNKLSGRMVNERLKLISMMYTYGVLYGWADINPAKGVPRERVPPRDRLVKEDEYAAMHDQLGRMGRVDIQLCMEFAYLMRARSIEVIALTDTPLCIREDGILLDRTKGSKAQIIAWTDRLRKAVDDAREWRAHIDQLRKAARKPPLVTESLIVTIGHKSIKRPALADAWQAARAALIKRGENMDWHFHDLKAMGVSGFKGDKLLASGHRSAQMANIYIRDLEVVPATR